MARNSMAPPVGFDPIEHHFRRRRHTNLEKFFRFLAILLIILCPIILVACFRVVKQYKRAVILRFGRVRKDSPAGPGIIFVIPFTDDVTIIDIRTQSLNLPPQTILTKDSVTVLVDAIVYFHVVQPVSCILNCQFHRASTELITIAILRTTLGQHSLTEVTEHRENLSVEARNEIDRITAAWGIQIERVEIKDLLLPPDLQKALAAEAEGRRIAKAKLIEAEGEIKTAEYLKEAASLMEENPQVLTLRYLQTVNSIAAKQQSTVLFPIPVDLPCE